MNAESPPKRTWRVASWLHARPAILGTFTGAALGLSTVILSAINAISAQQAIAMALPSIVALVGGLLHMIILDPWTAWQRGFQQGCQASAPCRLRVLDGGAAPVPGRDDVAEAGRLTSPPARAALRRVL
jgi:hypothetical protein